MKIPSEIILVHSARLLDHDTGGGDHPETADRLRCIEQRLQSGSLAPHLHYVAPEPASHEALLVFHSESWLLRFEEEVLSGRSYIGHPDNQVCYDSFDVALLSAGTGIKGVDVVEQDAGRCVFCATRPPGHHAEPSMSYGFCFLNNCVIAARYWQNRYNRRRICVLDFDAHHGNGIQTAFEEDPETLYISIHEHPSFSYPGTGYAEETGMGPGEGTILNIPLTPGSSDQKVVAALDGVVREKLEQFRPEAMIIAAGFDGHRLDDMSGLNYSTGLYSIIGERIGSWAGELCSGRVVSLLEGGYHLQSLAESVEAYLIALRGK
ncbi:MAG: histone deacetylase [Desulfobulbaceae bacterium]|jgi:acetoin utilization deacetylase AcuC-like enzyme|nr:histone deacetylase [Desulfobulbaceae bacterium]MDY0351282.1 histone deacetylase [Desulfobulbaceae bacterium]